MSFRLIRAAGRVTALASGILLVASGLVMSSASALPAQPCAVGIAPVGACTLASGGTITFNFKGGNGGPGGAGGNAEGGGLGGAGGAGGAGAKWEQGYTNSSGGTVTLEFTVGRMGSTGSVGSAGTGGNGGSAGGGGGGGEDTIIQVGSSTIAIALGGDGGGGGGGGGPTAGAVGASGADAPAGNLPTTNSEVSFIQITAIEFRAPASTGTTETVTVAFDGSGGTCTITSVSGLQGSWAVTPRASNCTLAGSTLSGWQARLDGIPLAPVYLPGTSINLTSDNTLYALWATSSSGGSTTPIPEVGEPSRVIWSFQKGKTVLRAGSPKDMMGRSPFVTLSTTKPSSVNAVMIRQAKAVAKEYGGTYGGVVRADTWNKPRIVAVYTS